MRSTIVTLGLVLIAGPALSQSPNTAQILQDLTTGDQSRDQVIHEAFERGYQHGRRDEARIRTERDQPENRDDYRLDRDNNQANRHSANH